MANADIVCRDIRMTGKGRTRVARTCGARPGVSLASAERGKAIGDTRNGYRRNALYAALRLPFSVRVEAFVSCGLYSWMKVVIAIGVTRARGLYHSLPPETASSSSSLRL